jgi:DNA mismatch repair protein MutS
MPVSGAWWYWTKLAGAPAPTTACRWPGRSPSIYTSRSAAAPLFATHYHELAQLADSLPQLRNYQVQVREQDGEVVFLHKIAPGSTDKSYGIHVARLAGVPLAVIERAESVLASLEMQHRLKTTPPATPNPRLTQPPERLASPTPRRKPPLRRNAPTDSPTLFGGNGEDKAG